MNKKGFTLVELLAVIIILGLLITITTTSVLSVTKETKAKMKETQLESLLDASDEYINDVIDGNASITPQVSGASEATSYSGYKFLEYVGSCDYTSATNAKFCYSGTSESGNLTITRVIYYDSSVLSKYIDFANFKISDTNNLCKLKIEVTVEKNKYDYYQLVSKKSLVRNGITANKCVK